METTTENNKPKPSKLTNDEIKLSSAILTAVEIGSSFKLYSYRVISPEQFNERIIELAENLLNSVKNAN